MDSPGSSSGRLRWLVLIVSVGALVLQAWRLDYVVDDAFISFRYARNLVEGHGLTYNPGEFPVEGYTNFLWTLLLAAGMAAGLDPLPLAKLLGVGSGALALLLAERLARRCGAGPWSLLVPAILAANPAFVTWSMGGLETTFFTSLVLTGALLATDPGAPRFAAGIALALACLTRPEGLLAATLVALGVFAAERQAGLVRLAPSAWPIGLAVITHVTWRWTYYHALLPNTFYAKTGDLGAQVVAGMDYVIAAFVVFVAGPFAAAAVVLAVRRWGRWRRVARRRQAPARPSLPAEATAARVTAALLIGYTLYVVAIGGDGLPMYRFLVPPLPFFAVVMAVAFQRAFASRPRAGFVAAALAVSLTYALGFIGFQYGYREWDRTVFVPKLVRIGRVLPTLVGAETTIALLAAGVIPYESRLRTIDMLALNDPVVARKQMRFVYARPGHWKYDAEEVLRRRPGIVLLNNVDVTQEPRRGVFPTSHVVEEDLLHLDEFPRLYERVSFPLPGGGFLNCFRLRKTPAAGGPQNVGSRG